MAVQDLYPVQTVREAKRTVIFFDNLIWRPNLANTVTAADVFKGTATVYPNGDSNDIYQLNLPQYAINSQITIDFDPKILLRVQSTGAFFVSPIAKLVYAFSSLIDNFKIDGGPFYLQLRPSQPTISIQKNSLEKIQIAGMNIGYAVDIINSSTTPLFTMNLGAVHDIYFYMQPMVILNEL